MWSYLAILFGIILVIFIILAIALYIQEKDADDFKPMDIDKLYKKVNGKKRKAKKNGKTKQI